VIVRRIGRNSRLKFALALLLAMSIPLLTSGCGTQVPSGHHGVKYLKFGEGTEMGKVYAEGFQWHFPWNSMYVYKTQTQESKETLNVLSSDGATIQLEVTVWYRPIFNKLDSLQVTVGPRYLDVVLKPALRGIARGTVGLYKPEEIYSTKRQEIAVEITAQMEVLMRSKFIEIQNVIFRDVLLPKKITDAINEKLAADQEQQRMTFVLLKEEQEAKRKRIEAQGISDFQKIVSSGLTADLLKWKGIEATEKLAVSPNAKIVVIGSGKDGLPLILGGN
jgi:regulator of protease activity HflC (stomatin/prohibitin superfamily)